jgi:hypothetical protein
MTTSTTPDTADPVGHGSFQVDTLVAWVDNRRQFKVCTTEDPPCSLPFIEKA